jgi:hypothetical protein
MTREYSVPNINVGGCQTPAGEPLMQLVAVDWFKDSKRIDHVVRSKDCVAQVCHYDVILFLKSPGKDTEGYP